MVMKRMEHIGDELHKPRVEFAPFATIVMESHGALGKAAQAIVKKLAKRIAEKRRATYTHTRH